MSLKAVWGSIVAMLFAMVLTGSVLIYSSTERDKIRAENRATLVQFVCAVTYLAANEVLVRRFREILDDIDETCPR